MSKDLLAPIKGIQIMDRTKLKPNNYNPNRVLAKNLDLLKRSILTNGFTQPVVVTKEFVIIDGYHRWLVSGQEPLKSLLGGKVPVVVVEHENESENMYGTITHNRARGQHLLEPMEKIVQSLLKQEVPIAEIEKQLGMKREEIWRLSGITREQFLEMMAKGHEFTKEKAYIYYR